MHLQTTITNKKMIGLLYHPRYDTQMKIGEYNAFIHRVVVMMPELTKHNYNMICYSPANIDKEKKIVTGYIFEDNKIKQVSVPMPHVTYDFYMGSDDTKSYEEFCAWPPGHGKIIYPSRALQILASDKLRAAQIISKFDPKIIPLTEIFDAQVEQVKKYLAKKTQVFIKPRYGNLGNKILVVKAKNNQFIAEYYINSKKQTSSFLSLEECVAYINLKVNGEKYIIQEAIDVMRFGDEVFDMRVLVFNLGKEWSFFSQIRVGAKSSELSNIAQGGRFELTVDFFEKYFPKEKALSLIENVKERIIKIADFLSKECNEIICEIAFDVMIDKSEDIYLAEINTKPGLAGTADYDNFSERTKYEQILFENLAVKHSEFLARSLVYRDSLVNHKQDLKKIFYKKKNEKFEFIFTGDTSFGENYQEKIKQRGGESILDRFSYDYGLEKLGPIMKDADFVVMNLETPITNCSKSPFEGRKDYIHWTHIEKAPKTLIDHNVSLVSIANNHSFDYGLEGHDQTLSILKEYNLPVIGAGDNIHQASEPFIAEINFEDKKITIAIIAAFKEVANYRDKFKVYADDQKPGLMPLDPKIIANRVQKIKSLYPNAFVILCPHWGNGYEWCDDEQIKLCDDLFASGIDLIIGHGSHMIQEFEKCQGKLVLYSIGNLMFHSPGRYAQMQAPPYSFVASLNVQIVNDQLDIQLKLYPIVSDNKITNYQPRFVNKSELNDLRKCLLQRKIMSYSEYLFDAQQDQFGYYFQVPSCGPPVHCHPRAPRHPHEGGDDIYAPKNDKDKWIGLLYHDSHDDSIRNNKFSVIMHRASALAPVLANHGYKLICYSPQNVNKEAKTVVGYAFENNEFKETIVDLPKINHDFYIGADGLDIYRKFQNWALDQGCRLYPTKAIRKLAQDKLLAARVISKFDNAIIPYTEEFDGTADQIQKYLLKKTIVFIKPRYGGRGNKILVVKSENDVFVAEYYNGTRKQIASFPALPECVSYINSLANEEKHIIQEAVDVITYEGSVFDIRALVFNEGSKWHFMSEVRIGIKSSEISNNGGTDIPIDFLERIFSKEKASKIMEKIKETTLNLTIFLSREYNELINELAFDVMVDKSGNIYLAEINTKAGLAGLTKYGDFFNMTDYEKNFYEKLSVPHGEFLAKSLLCKDS